MIFYRKGSIPLRGTAALVLAALGLLIGIMALSNIHANSIEPNMNKTEILINSFQNRKVVIGDSCSGGSQVVCDKTDNYPPEAQLRALTVFNMLGASNCRLISGVSSSMLNRNYFSRGFDPAIKDTDFEGFRACANAIDIDYTVPSRLIPLWNENNPSNDIEGRYGRIYFDINETFTMNSGNRGNAGYSRRNKLLNINVPNSNGIDFNSAPGFWNGMVTSAFIPDVRAKSNDYQKNWELYSDEGIETTIVEDAPSDIQITMYDYISDTPGVDRKSAVTAWRVRMKNVPMILPADSTYQDQSSEKSSPGSSEGQFERFVEEVKYRFCRGAEGYIQSNAKYPYVGGDATGRIKDRENTVFPKIVIEHNPTREGECIKTIYQSDIQITGFEAYEINGNYCSMDKIGTRRTFNGKKYICHYKKEEKSFLNYEGDVVVFRPGWFQT